jgi:hypothetical protein
MMTDADLALADLRASFPHWQIWVVPLAVGGQTWCARPLGDTRPVLNADSAEHLAEYLRERES